MKIALVVLSIAVAVLLVLVGALWFWRNDQGTVAIPPNENLQLNQKAGEGSIEGSLGYPSEGIPDEMKICAENVSTKELTCTDQKINNRKYTYGEGYRLEVPAGTYHVFASLAGSGAGGSAFDNYRAYYSEFVTCGLEANCLSHAPVKVIVRADQTTSQVDPIDWYNVQD